jgi:hypothetical protein
MAEAEAAAIARVRAALPEGEAATYLLGLKYLEALPAIAQGKGTTIFLPAEATGVLGALGGMRELLRAGAAPQGTPAGGPPPLRGSSRPATAPGTPATPAGGEAPPRALLERGSSSGAPEQDL